MVKLNMVIPLKKLKRQTQTNHDSNSTRDAERLNPRVPYLPFELTSERIIRLRSF